MATLFEIIWPLFDCLCNSYYVLTEVTIVSLHLHKPLNAHLPGRAELIRLIAAAGGVTITEAAEEFAKPAISTGKYLSYMRAYDMLIYNILPPLSV